VIQFQIGITDLAPKKRTSVNNCVFFTKYFESYREVMKSIDSLDTSPILKGIGKLMTTLKMLIEMGVTLVLFIILLGKITSLL